MRPFRLSRSPSKMFSYQSRAAAGSVDRKCRVVETEPFGVLDDLDLRAPRVLDEGELEEAVNSASALNASSNPPAHPATSSPRVPAAAIAIDSPDSSSS